jgi:phenylalanyl-tRNA synthetase beta chain
VTYPAIRAMELTDPPELQLQDQVRDIMVGMGFAECITFSFVQEEVPDQLGAEPESPLRSAVHLLKPLTQEQSVMRTSLIPGIMAAARNNIDNGQSDLKLFEWGKVFFHRQDRDLPDERLMLTVLMTGLVEPKTWYGDEIKCDFYHIKGVLETLFDDFNFPEPVFTKHPHPPWYDPEQVTAVKAGDRVVGHAGKMIPAVLERFEVRTREVFLMEVDMHAFMECRPSKTRYTGFGKFPAVYRDLSMIVSRKTESSRIQELIKEAGRGLVEKSWIYDLYEGEKMSPTEKTLTFRIAYRSKEGTLEGAEINRLHESVIGLIKKETGGRLPEG